MEPLETVQSSAGIPAFLVEFQSKSKRSATLRILRDAKRRGSITTSEIAELLPGRILKDRALLFEIIEQFGKYLDGSSVSLVNSRWSDQVRERERLSQADSRKDTAVPAGDEAKHAREAQLARKEKGIAKGTFSTPISPALYPDHSPEEGDEKEPDVGELLATEDDANKAILSDLEQLEAETNYLQDPLLWYYKECYKYRLLKPEEEIDFARRVREEGDLEARNALVCHNLRLVRHIARRYAWSRLPFADLIQEGNLGLMIAAERFDYRMGRRFSTYAFWWIRQSITRAVMEQSDVIRLPVHVGELRLKVLHATEKLCRGDGRIPTPEVLAEYLEVPLEQVKNTLRAMQLQTTLSLDSRMNGKGGSEDDAGLALEDVVADPNVADPATVLEAKQELEAIYRDLRIVLDAVKELPGDRRRNVAVFKEMHGLNDAGEKKTLEEVGQEFGVTRERIRQILVKIFDKLAEQGIEVDQEALKDHLWRVHELEKLCGTSIGLED